MEEINKIWIVYKRIMSQKEDYLCIVLCAENKYDSRNRYSGKIADGLVRVN